MAIFLVSGPALVSIAAGAVVFVTVVGIGWYVLRTQPAAKSPESQRAAFLRSLDTVEGYVARFYLSLLYLMMAGATVLMALLYFKYPDDGNRDFMLMYGGVLYVLAMLGLTTGVSKTRARLRPATEEDRLPQFSTNLNITFQTSSEVQFVGREALDRAQRVMDSGGTLDDACAAMDARYLKMNRAMKAAFRTAVEVALQEHRKDSRHE